MNGAWIEPAIAILGLAVPVFWLGIVIVLLLVTYFNWK